MAALATHAAAVTLTSNPDIEPTYVVVDTLGSLVNLINNVLVGDDTPMIVTTPAAKWTITAAAA